jgi:hypothetical protein
MILKEILMWVNIIMPIKKTVKRKGSWVAAVSKARKALGITGFVPVKKGTALYKKAKALQGK